MYFEAAVLLDWGVKNIRHDVPEVRVGRWLVPSLSQMLDHFGPAVLLVPDLRPGAIRRSPHVQVTVRAIAKEAVKRGITVHAVSDEQVRRTFERVGGKPVKNKQAINRIVIEWFPELRPLLPKKRKLWEPERYATPLFAAVAMYCAWQGIPLVARER